MKKKIAVFSTGWASEILSKYLLGLRDGLQNEAADIYLFLNHATHANSNNYLHGEFNIFSLPDMRDFDAALVFGNAIDFPDKLKWLNDRFDAAGIPVIYTGQEFPQYYFVGSDNYLGAKALCDHMIEHHKVTDLLFIAGNPENMDSNARLQAFLDSMKAHGLSVNPNRDIFYSNWEPQKASDYIVNIIQNNEKLPEVIICANDILAMVLCNTLRNHGISVPGDICITGFDNELMAQVYDPSISSVDQRFDLVGKKCSELLIDIFNGRTIERVHRINCEFVPSESCGCVNAKDFYYIRREVGRNKFLDHNYFSSFDLEIAQLERFVMPGKTYNDLSLYLREAFTRNIAYEGDSFCIVIDPTYEKYITDKEGQLRTDGYPEIMDVVVSREHEKIERIQRFPSRLIVPPRDTPEVNHQYTIAPLHEEEHCLGYIVFDDGFSKIINSRLIRTYCERMNMLLSKYLRDRRADFLFDRLLQLTETDALTRVKNRTAFSSSNARLQNEINSGYCEPFAIAAFDVNNLKYINDNYGHDSGDEYLVNSCQLICQTFKKSAVYRVGGDEFVVILKNTDYENRDQLMNEIYQKALDFAADDKLLPMQKVSIAGGLAVFNPVSDRYFNDILKRADANMYEKKAQMKTVK